MKMHLAAAAAALVTRDVVMSEYLSEVVMKDGRLFMKNIGTIERVKDACKEFKIGRCGQ